MPDTDLSPPTPANTTPLAPQDCASPTPTTAVIVAGDRFALRGLVSLLGRVHSIGSIEAHGSIDAAMSGPRTDLLVVHTGTPGLTIKPVAALVERRQARVLLAAGVCGPSRLAELRAAGAHGLLTGAETTELCASMIQLALAGCSCWPAAAAINPDKNKVFHSIPAPALTLTARQREVAAELARGHSNKIIAATLGMSEGTVKIHLTAVYRTLGVSNRAMAVARLLPEFGSSTCMDCAVEERGKCP